MKTTVSRPHFTAHSGGVGVFVGDFGGGWQGTDAEMGNGVAWLGAEDDSEGDVGRFSGWEGVADRKWVTEFSGAGDVIVSKMTGAGFPALGRVGSVTWAGFSGVGRLGGVTWARFPAVGRLPEMTGEGFPTVVRLGRVTRAAIAARYRENFSAGEGSESGGLGEDLGGNRTGTAGGSEKVHHLRGRGK